MNSRVRALHWARDHGQDYIADFIEGDSKIHHFTKDDVVTKLRGCCNEPNNELARIHGYDMLFGAIKSYAQKTNSDEVCDFDDWMEICMKNPRIDPVFVGYIIKWAKTNGYNKSVNASNFIEVANRWAKDHGYDDIDKSLSRNQDHQLSFDSDYQIRYESRRNVS